MKNLIEIQQDANEKIIIKLPENIFNFYLKKYFNWKKDIGLNRFNKLGTFEHDKFIKYLSLKIN